MTLILTRSELETLTDMPATIAAVERALGDISLGLAHQPTPVAMHLPSSDARFLPMAALADYEQLAAVKLLSDIPGNAASGLPTQRSTVMLTSQQTGETLAVLDGRVPTRVRTAAASAVASKHLARPDSRTLGLVGAGALAIAHVEAISQVLPIDTVVVWTRSADTLRSFRAAVEHHGFTVVEADTVRQVVESADVLCTLTPSQQPIVAGAWFTPGLHVNAVGARPRPDHREIDSHGMVVSRIFVDSMGTALEKSGELVIPMREGALGAAPVHAELGEVITKKATGRSDSHEITLFDSVGIGLQDLAIGKLLYLKAMERGLGLEIDLGS